ncbi:MAG: hypothetical protein NBV77_07630 [Bacteroidia bacterium]|jgi:Flp pilus assembly protein TadB|nr:hypothetical protein [Bacteroidia bacterium]
MQNSKANEILEKAIASIEKNGIDASTLIQPLQEAREYALKENDPLVTRALRLAWQHLEANETFDAPLAEDMETAEDNLVYFLSLCVKSQHELNRTELREMTNQLQELA